MDRLVDLRPGAAFRFVVYGDSRPNAQHARLLRAVGSYEPDFVLHTGDLVSRGTDPSQWRRFEAQTNGFRRRFPFLPALGNHDRGPFFVRVFQLPYADSSNLYYSFRVANCKFIALNSEIAGGSAAWREQLCWLQRQLADASVDHIFVYLHRPPFSPNPRRDPVNRAIAEELLPIVRRATGVRAVFCGHDHFYYRTQREGLTIVTTGGGGAGLYPVDRRRLRPGDRWATAFHFILVEVDGKRVDARVIRRDGKVLDRFTLAGGPHEREVASRLQKVWQEGAK